MQYFLANLECVLIFKQQISSCDCLVITNFQNDIDASKEKKGIAITARVHPGETQASFVMEHIIDFLIGPSVEAKLLRDNFIIKVLEAVE